MKDEGGDRPVFTTHHSLLTTHHSPLTTHSVLIHPSPAGEHYSGRSKDSQPQLKDIQ